MMASGERCVMIIGTLRMPLSCAENWATSEPSTHLDMPRMVQGVERLVEGGKEEGGQVILLVI